MNALYTTDTVYEHAVKEGAQAVISGWNKTPKKFRGGLILGKLVIGALMQIRGQKTAWFDALSDDDQKSLADDLINSAKDVIYNRVTH